MDASLNAPYLAPINQQQQQQLSLEYQDIYQKAINLILTSYSCFFACLVHSLLDFGIVVCYCFANSNKSLDS